MNSPYVPLRYDPELADRIGPAPKPRTERLLEFAKFMEDLPTQAEPGLEPSFSLDDWFYDEECRTPACIAAHAVTKYYPERNFRKPLGPFSLEFTRSLIASGAAILGLSHEVAMNLFLPDFAPGDFEVTSQHAAAALRAVACGKESEDDIWAQAINDYELNYDPTPNFEE